jgi:hypothetical protein
MKEVLLAISLCYATLTNAQTLNVPRTITRGSQQPLPKIKTIKPDLSVTLNEIVGITYDETLRAHKIAVNATIKNESDLTLSNVMLGAEMEHVGFGADHVYFQPCREAVNIGTISSHQTITGAYVFIKTGRPRNGFSHPFRLIIDSNLRFNETNEENNFSNILDATYTSTSSE